MAPLKRATTLMVLLTMALAAGGCGQKGPLTMPAPAAPGASAAATR